MKKIRLVIVLIMFFLAWYFYPVLPEMMPMHWNVRGEIDRYMVKSQAVWVFPLITLLMFVGFELLPSIDPKREKYKLFTKEWEIIKTVFIGLFAYMQFVVFYLSNSKDQILPLFFIGLGAFFIILGNFLSKIRQNFFIGIRVPWTLSDEDNWNKTHRFASWCFVIAGLVIFTESIFIWFAPAVIMISIIIAAILPIIYSFLYFKKAEEKMKYVYIGLFLIIAVIFSIRLASGEDDWICESGKWVRHGNPSFPAPTSPCR
jgi:uncharacterized membrane protein